MTGAPRLAPDVAGGSCEARKPADDPEYLVVHDQIHPISA
jgi:hypothetical protein